MPPKKVTKRKLNPKKLDMINPFSEGAEEVLEKRRKKKEINKFAEGADKIDKIDKEEVHEIHKDGYKRGSLAMLLKKRTLK